MSMKKISDQRWEHIEEYNLCFDRVGDYKHCGYAFECDKDGNVFPLTSTQQESWDDVQANLNLYHKPYVEDWSRDYRHPAVYECDLCGSTAYESRSCGVHVCDNCGNHNGLARCFCGWSLSGGDGYRELIEMGERIDDDDY